MRASAEARLDGIVYFGKVLDQHGDPVSGAVVTYTAQSGYLAEGDGKQLTSTNEDGIFEISGVKGVGLTIIGIAQDGYRIGLGELQYFDNYMRFDDSQLWSDHSSLENAAFYPAWKIEGPYPHTSLAESGYHLEPGTTYSLDFLKREGKVDVVEGRHNLDLIVRIDRTETDWSMTLETPNGGLIEHDGSTAYQAPLDGYFRTEVLITGGREGLATEKHFFIRSRDLYSRVSLEIVAHYGPKSQLGYRVLVNLDGDRTLLVPKNEDPW